jgi:hypothetical protein
MYADIFFKVEHSLINNSLKVFQSYGDEWVMQNGDEWGSF